MFRRFCTRDASLLNLGRVSYASEKLCATLCKGDGWRFFELRDANKTGCGLRTAIESRGQDEDGARDSEEDAGAAFGSDRADDADYVDDADLGRGLRRCSRPP